VGSTSTKLATTAITDCGAQLLETAGLLFRRLLGEKISLGVARQLQFFHRLLLGPLTGCFFWNNADFGPLSSMQVPL
jgi:hypothetical protein